MSISENFMPISCLELNGQCFVDRGEGNRVLPDAFWESDDMTILGCKKHCWLYKYAGVEFAKECWCGNDKPKNPAPETDCSSPCTGDQSEKCGAGHRINVYQLHNSAKDANTVLIANERLTAAVLKGMADHLKKNNFF